MSKFEEKVEKYIAEMTGKLKVGRVDKKLFTAVAKACGPSLYRKDAERVSTKDPKEMDRVKKNFLIKKLGLKDDPKLDAAISKAAAAFGSGNRNKYRAIFYYFLVKELRQGGKFK